MIENYRTTPVSYLRSWYEANKGVIEKTCSSHEFKKPKAGMACVDLDTTKTVSQICVWDNAICLDIQVIDIENDATTFPTTGACGSMEEFTKKLDEHLEWIKSQ